MYENFIIMFDKLQNIVGAVKQACIWSCYINAGISFGGAVPMCFIGNEEHCLEKQR